MKTGSNLIEEVVLWLRVEKIEENQPDYRRKDHDELWPLCQE